MFLTLRNVCGGSVSTGFTTRAGELGLLNHQFSTQLAPQQISSFLGASAQIQEQQGALNLHFKAFI